jgi:hypothetical protein
MHQTRQLLLAAPNAAAPRLLRWDAAVPFARFRAGLAVTELVDRGGEERRCLRWREAGRGAPYLADREGAGAGAAIPSFDLVREDIVAASG